MGIHPQLANVNLAVYGDLAVGRDFILNNPPVRGAVFVEGPADDEPGENGDDDEEVVEKEGVHSVLNGVDRLGRLRLDYARRLGGGGLLQPGPGGCCSPRGPTHFAPSPLDLHGIL